MQLSDEQVVILQEIDRVRAEIAHYEANCVETPAEHVIRFVDNYRPTYLEAATRRLPECDGVDGFSCYDPAVVHHLASEQEFCLAHFQFFERHHADEFDPYQFGRQCN